MPKYRRLTRTDRVTIQKRLEQGKQKIEIAEELGVHRSSIGREISRNKSLFRPYRWRGAQASAYSRRRYKLDYTRKITGALEELVSSWLRLGYSPEQISGRLKLERAQWSLSHESIYRWIYNVAPAHKVFLRWKHRKRQNRSGLPRRSLQSPSRKMIDERPLAANERLEKGHWERDLLMGQMSGPALLVIQDRKTRLTLLRKVKNKTSDEVNKKTAEALAEYETRSTTNDNGVEFSNFEKLEKQLNAPVFYCHPYTSSERGMVENTNGLLRQYFPKGCDFTKFSEEQIVQAQDAINRRPKKVLGYRSPHEVENECELKYVLSKETYQKRIRENLEIFFDSFYV